MHLLKNILSIGFVSMIIVSTFVAAQDTQKRNSLLSKQVGNRKNIFQKQTTTTTTEATHEDGEAEYADEEYVDEENDHAISSSTTTTTTEVPKKMIRPSVRPMRSNEDLLSALKKRRLTEKNNKAQAKPATQEEKQPQNYESEIKTVKVKTTSAPKANSHKRFGGHKSTNVKAAPVQDDNHAQTIEEPSQKTFKRSNRFSARQN